MGLLTDRINNKLEISNLINESALNREPVPLISFIGDILYEVFLQPRSIGRVGENPGNEVGIFNAMTLSYTLIFLAP